MERQRVEVSGKSPREEIARVLVRLEEWLREDQPGVKVRRLTACGDRIELGEDGLHFLDATAAPRRLGEVKHRRPAHETVERAGALIEHWPEVTERVLVASLAERGGTPREVSGREQWPSLHRKQTSLGFGEDRFDGLARTAHHFDPRQDELRGQAILRLTRVTPESGRLLRGRRGCVPLGGVSRRPREVHQSLSQWTEPGLRAHAGHRTI